MNEATSLRQYWPACAHGSVLIATQELRINLPAQRLHHLGNLTDGEGLQLMLKQMDVEARQALQAELDHSQWLGYSISREVQGLPLLLVNVAGHLAVSGASLADTLEDLKHSRWDRNGFSGSLLEEAASFSYGKSLHQAFDLSLARLDKPAMTALYAMSMLSPDNIIPEALLVAAGHSGHHQSLDGESRRRSV